MSMKIKLPLLLVAICTPIYGHSTVYKCTTEDGEIVFQQIPCSADQEQENIKIPPGPSQQDVEAAHARLRAYERAERESRNGDQQSDSAHGPHRQPNAAQFGSEYSENESSTTNSSPCPPGQVPLNPSKVDPSRGWSKSKGYVPLRCGTPGTRANDRAVRTGPGISEPRRIQDQYGNWYTQQPGSSFATDEKTGKQCFVYGDFVRCD